MNYSSFGGHAMSEKEIIGNIIIALIQTKSITNASKAAEAFNILLPAVSSPGGKPLWELNNDDE